MVNIIELTGILFPDPPVTLTDRIASGQYDWISDDITEKQVPLTPSYSSRRLDLAHFEVRMTSKLVKTWATKNGYDVAFVEDLLAVGSHPEYRELQRQFPIIALGSSGVLFGHRRVPVLNESYAMRNLHYIWYGGGWDAYCRFLLRKKPLAT